MGNPMIKMKTLPPEKVKQGKELIAKISGLVEGGLSPVLYHWTPLYKGLVNLNNNAFILNKPENISFHDNKYAGVRYLSTTRSKLGGYHITEHSGIVFVLDGNALKTKYKGKAFDYWHNFPSEPKPSDTRTVDEMEDRIISKDKEIPLSKYTREIHVMDSDGIDHDKYIEHIIDKAASLGLPCYLYKHEADWRNLDKRKARTQPEKIAAGLSSVLYHWTLLPNAISILKDDRFKLTKPELYGDKEGYYYLSTTRSKLGGYHINRKGVVFVLDGAALSKEHKGEPFDYYEKSERTRPSEDTREGDEMEDRVLSKKPAIEHASKYIKEIHLCLSTNHIFTNEHYLGNVQNFIALAKKRGIPIYIYEFKDMLAWLNQDKRKAMPLEKFKVEAAQDNWPYYRISSTKKMPTVTKQTDDPHEGSDPAGIYFFIKGKPSSSSVYETKRPYVWEGRLKSSRVLNLGDITWDTAWVWLKKAGIANEKEFVDVLFTCLQTFNIFMDTLGFQGEENERDEIAQELKTKNKEVIWSWFRILRKKINNSEKLAQFFLDLGYDAIIDPNDYLYGDEPQMIVLNEFAIEMRLADAEDSKQYQKTVTALVKFNNWVDLTDEQIKQEYEWEYISHQKRSGFNPWPTLEEFKKAVTDGDVEALTEAADRNVGNRSRCKDLEDLKDLTSGYRFPRDVDRIVRGYKEGHAMPYPIILEQGTRRWVMSGNTRLDAAFIMGITPKVLVLKVPSFKDKVLAKYIIAMTNPAIEWMKKFFDDSELDRYYESKMKVTPTIQKELKQFCPKTSLTVFRGLYWPSPDDYLKASNKMSADVPSSGDSITYHDDTFSSWSTRYEAAHGYARDADPEGLHIVLRMTVQAKDILLDTDLIPQEVLDNFRYKSGDFKESREIVVKPKSYKVTVVSVDWTDDDGWQDDCLPEYEDYSKGAD